MSGSLRSHPGGAWASELVGVAAVVLAALTAIRWTMGPDAVANHWPLHLQILVIGMSVGATITAVALSPLGRRSGAHLNPAVSLFMTLRGELSVRDLAGYAAAQLAGSVVGVLLARLLWQSAMRPIADGAIQPSLAMGALATAVVEVAATLALLLSIAWLTARPRPVLTAVGIGVVVAALITVTGANAGGSFNPARNFGPQVLSGVTGLLAIYLVAPLAAAPIAAVILSAAGFPRRGPARSPEIGTTSVSRYRIRRHPSGAG